MAIGTSGGGSAASRFRPRGTAPQAGLGRRNLLVEDNNETGEEPAQEEEKLESTGRAEAQLQGFVRRGQTAQAVANRVIAEAEQAEESATTSEASPSSTSIDPSPSPAATTSARKRGRPLGSTNRAVTPASPETGPSSPVAYSVSDARARMREIEAQAKAMKVQYNQDLATLNNDYRARSADLQQEYQTLSQLILDQTFGF